MSSVGESDTLRQLGHPFYDRDSEAAHWRTGTPIHYPRTCAYCPRAARYRIDPQRVHVCADHYPSRRYRVGGVSHAERS